MARPKKTELSPAVGTVKAGTKRGNPDFVSSSFYVPKQVNYAFDKALLTLKANGYQLDRSDILSVLMDRFSTAVSAAEAQVDEEGLDLNSILAAASDAVLQGAAETSTLRKAIEGQLKDVSEAATLMKEMLVEARMASKTGD